jgi:hypothetical protein
MKYEILQARSSRELCEKVETYLSKGWKLYGSVGAYVEQHFNRPGAIQLLVWFQAVTKKENK